MADKYKDLNNELFRKILFEIVDLKCGAPHFLLIEYPNVYSIVSEALNNEVLKAYESEYLDE